MSIFEKQLNGLADDIASFSVKNITVILCPHHGLAQNEFDELKKIMAVRYAWVILRPASIKHQHSNA